VLDEKCATAVSTGGDARPILIATHGETLLSFCLFHDGSKLAIGTAKGRVELRFAPVGPSDITAVDPPAPIDDTIRIGSGPVFSLSELPSVGGDSKRQRRLVASVTGEVVLIDVESRCLLRSLAASITHDQLFAEVVREFMPLRRAPHGDAPTVVIGGGTVIGNGGTAGGTRLSGRLVRLSIDPDGLDDAVVWDVKHAVPVYAMDVAPSAESPLLAAASGSTVVLHAGLDGSPLRHVIAGQGILYALAFDPCGTCLIAAGSEEAVHAFNVPDGSKRGVMRLDRDAGRERKLSTATISALAFQDDHTFLSGGDDAVLTKWHLPAPPGPPIPRAAAPLPVAAHDTCCATCSSEAGCERGEVALALAKAASWQRIPHSRC